MVSDMLQLCPNCAAGIHRSCRIYSNCECGCYMTVPDVVREAERVIQQTFASMMADVYEKEA